MDSLLGANTAIEDLKHDIQKAALVRAPVLIVGESGTGKELIARRLHDASDYCDQPFVAVNCSAIPDNLLESELFGHAKGAFTDAKSDRAGLLELAGEGVLFLDEIGDLPKPLQPKILRALQERKYRRVGDSKERPFSARVICATNIDLEHAVTERTFREDLYYRINVIELRVPPLRERGGDIELLAEAFVLRYGSGHKKLGPKVLPLLRAYSWPGNVRELQNCIERAVAMCEEEVISVDDLSPRVRSAAALATSSSENLGEERELRPLWEVEKEHILYVLAQVSGNKQAAARILKLDRKTLYRKLDKYLRQ